MHVEGVLAKRNNNAADARDFDFVLCKNVE
jgi:hypothetical protein